MDEQHTQVYHRQDEEEPMQLGDVLEPYDDEGYAPQQEGELYEEYDEPYDGEEYSDLHEELDIAGRFKVAMGVFDMVSILVGVFVILMLAAMLIGLVNWLNSDISHSVLLLQSGLQ